MKIMKKIVSTSCIFLFASVDMWTKRCLSILCFLSVMYSSQFWQKSVDRWTNNENYEKKISISFILFLESANLWTSSCHSILFLLSTIQNFDQKMWTDEKKWKFLKKIVLTSCIFLFANVDMWTKRCLSTTCFLSVMYSSQFWQKSVDRWTSNENYEKKL